MKDKNSNLKYRYGNRKFWCRGFDVDTVGRTKKKNQEYIRNQLKEDYMSDQLTQFEEYDPFTGRKIRRIKRFFKNQWENVVQEGNPFGGPFRPRPVIEASSHRANHQFTLVVLFIYLV